MHDVYQLAIASHRAGRVPLRFEHVGNLRFADRHVTLPFSIVWIKNRKPLREFQVLAICCKRAMQVTLQFHRMTDRAPAAPHVPLRFGVIRFTRHEQFSGSQALAIRL
jgi:hypothetical protein